MNLRKYTPYLAALVIFITVTFIAFPPLFSGKVVDQTDIRQFKNMSHETFAFREQYGKEPLWNTTMYCGMPTTQISMIYKGNLLGPVDDAVHLWLPKPARYIFLCFAGFFVLMISLNVNPWLALAGSLGFGLATLLFLNAEAGHNSKSNAIDYLPFIFAGIIWMMNGKRALGFALVCLFMGLEFSANHIQITYYGFLLFFLVFVAYFIDALRHKKLKNFFIAAALFLCGTLIGILPNAGNLMMTAEYSKFSNRSKTELTMGPDRRSNLADQTGGISKQYALEWSNDFSELGTFIIPGYKGGASKPLGKTAHADIAAADAGYQEILRTIPSYFGSQPFTNGPVYFGIIITVFGLAGAFFVKHQLKWPLVITALLAILLSLGPNSEWLTDLFLKFVPGYNKFRSVTMILVLAQLCLAMLAVLGLDQFLKSAKPAKESAESDHRKTVRSVKIATIAVLLFCLVTALAPQLFLTMEKPDEAAGYKAKFLSQGYSEELASKYTGDLLFNVEETRKGLVRTDALRSILFLSCAFLLFYLYERKKIKTAYFIAGFTVLAGTDLLLVDNRIINSGSYISKEEADAPPTLTKMDEHILLDSSYYRVANGLADNPFLEAATSYYHHSIGGYHPAKLQIYEDLCTFCLKPELAEFALGIDSVKKVDSLLSSFMKRFPALNMLNTKYFIIRNGAGKGLITNLAATGNCWLVSSVREYPSADSEIVALNHFDPASTALMTSDAKKEAAVASSYSASGTIHLNSHLPNEMVYESETDSKAFAVFSEIWYPAGWKATIDGAPAKIVRVNYVLRGLEIPAGKHRIVFTYAPEAYEKGNSIAFAGSLVLIITVLTGLGFAWRMEKRSS